MNLKTHIVYFYGPTKIITGHNSLHESTINKRNQIVGFDGIDMNPELVEFGEKCLNAVNSKGGIGETGTLYPDNKTIVPFRYFYNENLIISHLEDVIIANEKYIKADSINFPLMDLKIATSEAYDRLGNDVGIQNEKEINFKNNWCCFGHYYLHLLKKALHNKGYITADQSFNLSNTEFRGPNGLKLFINAEAGL